MSPTNTSTVVTAYQRPDGSTIMRPAFAWTGAREQAAIEIAEGCFRPREIADHVGVETAAISAWLREPEFRARVEEHIAEIRERVVHLGIARTEIRITKMNDRWLRGHQLIEDRAAEAYDTPGGKTGLLAREEKMIGGGPLAEKVEVYKVDTGLLKELRELEMSAAKQLNQLTERVELSSPAGSVQAQAAELADLMTMDELEMLKRRLQERAISSGNGNCTVIGIIGSEVNSAPQENSMEEVSA